MVGPWHSSAAANMGELHLLTGGLAGQSHPGSNDPPVLESLQKINKISLTIMAWNQSISWELFSE
jgi:hypothetical protein